MKRVIWIGSSHDDLLRFPKSVQNAMGYVLFRAQLGERHAHVKTLSGMGSAKILEIKENAPSGTYRMMYTVEMNEFIFVLHVFQKKSQIGKETPKKELDLLEARLKEAREHYKELQGKR